MPFLLLLFLGLACMPIKWPRPAAGWNEGECAALTWGAVAAIVATAALIARWVRTRMARDPATLETILHRYSLLRLYHLFGLFAVFGTALSGLGWGWTVRQWCTPAGTEEMLPLAEFVILAPFFAAMVCSWICFYDAERALHAATPVGYLRPYWGRWAYVGFHVRQNLAIVLVPLSLLIGLQSVVRQFPGLRDDLRVPGVAATVMLGLFLTMPWIMRLVLGLRSLPPGPLRNRLGKAADRLHFRCSDVLLWNTRGGVANALVVGVLPWLRYVVLTDRLISDLKPEEVEAVFGHEVGHVKHHHMLYYLGFLVMSMMVVIGLWMIIVGALGPVAQAYLPSNIAFLFDPEEDWAGLPLAGMLGTYIFVVFGFLSRRCERQADIFGCRAVSCPRADCLEHAPDLVPSLGGTSLCPTGIRTFISALEKVARLNGISRNRPGWLQSWQHSTIARRVEFLYQILLHPDLEPRFQRTVAVVKWLLLLALGATLAVLAATQDWKTWALF